MRTFPAALTFAALLALAPCAGAGLLSASGVTVLDGNSLPRATFTNSERITFQQRVYNGVASSNRITFTFIVLNPGGSQVFQIAGNAVPGTVGNAATQLSGFPITKFYSGPGVYTLQALASLDGVTVTQQTTFVISSPSLLLLYPPNGAQNVADVPLTFRWVSSGGSTYRVTVGDNPSFYNSLFAQSTVGGETFLSYPVHPSDSRQILSAGQVYYWKVEALDASGQVVSASASPYSFTVQNAALSRDIAVTALEVSGAPDAQGSIPFTATVVNQGGTAQSGVPLRFSVGGLPAPGSPLSMAMLSPGESRVYSFSEALPAGQSQNLAIACVEFSDDNLPNNCKTLMVNQATQPSGVVDFGGAMSSDQIWQAISDLLRQQGMDLSDYNLVGMEGELSPEELRSLLDSIRSGAADVSLSGLSPDATAAATGATAVGQVSSTTIKAPTVAAETGVAPEMVEFVPLGTEWTGFSAPLASRASGRVVSDEKSWKKLWKLLRSGRVPAVDFSQHMVVGVFGGKGEKRDHAEIDAVQMSLSGLRVRYRFAAYATFDVDKAPRATVPYRLRVIPKTAVPVQFDGEGQD